MSIEIFVRSTTAAGATAWMETLLGQLIETEVDDGIHYLRAQSGDVVVVVNTQMDDPDFVSIFVNGDGTPWSRSRQLAGRCVGDLGKTVRWCDETTNRWMEQAPDTPAAEVHWDV